MVFMRIENNVPYLYRMDANGSNITKLSGTTKGEDSPSWSPGT